VSRARPPVSNQRQVSPADFYSKIRGITQRNADGTDRQKLARRLKVGQRLSLVREPDNVADPNAIMVCTEGGILRRPRQLGYLSADLAEDYASHLDAGGRIDVEVSEVTGGTGWLWMRKNFGVNIHVTVYGSRRQV